MLRAVALIVLALLLTAQVAAAQSSPSTCSHDADTRTVTVTVNGEKASLVVAGTISLNSRNCGDATATNTDTIIVTGGGLPENFLFKGTFAPGATPEMDASSEIEMSIDLGGGHDTVRWQGSNGDDTFRLSAGGVDFAGDGDQDVTVAGSVESIRVLGFQGNDIIDASLYTGTAALTLDGQYGSNTILGSPGADVLVSISGFSDEIHGGDGNDVFEMEAPYGIFYGDGGNDAFLQYALGSSSDLIHGGDGRDTVDYSSRTDPVTVTPGNGLADDGRAGENDAIDLDVENVIGGSGDDVLVGSSAANTLEGGAGDDEVYGGAGNDVLRGGDGADILAGDTGADTLVGGIGADSLDGGAGNDELNGGAGNDVLTGGMGMDFFRGQGGDDIFHNEDGIAETVVCGAGSADNPEPSTTDTFIDCELI